MNYFWIPVASILPILGRQRTAHGTDRETIQILIFLLVIRDYCGGYHYYYCCLWQILAKIVFYTYKPHLGKKKKSFVFSTCNRVSQKFGIKSRASNIAFLLDLAQILDLDFGLIQQNTSPQKASFQYQGCPLSLKNGKLRLNSYIFRIRITSN